MAYRVIQWGTGSVGRHALRAVLDSPDLELVGVKVHNGEKAGKDAGALCGLPLTGVIATLDHRSLPLSRADCVLYMPMLPDYDEIAHLLRSGVNVITTAANVYPKTYGEEIVGKLQAACREGNSSFHGSGINPAFMSDVLPLTLSGLSHKPRRIIVQEVADVNHYASTAPEIMLDNIGFGKAPQDALQPDNPFITWMSAYFRESMEMICDHLGVTLESVRSNHEVAVARSRVTLDCGRIIEPGTVACRRFEWQGVVRGRTAIVLRTYWKTTMDIDPAWPVGSEREVEWTVTIEGTPSYQCKISTCASFDPNDEECGRGGEEAAVIGTAVHAVNAIPYVCAAPPGIRTFLELPIIAGRAAFQGS